MKNKTVKKSKKNCTQFFYTVLPYTLLILFFFNMKFFLLLLFFLLPIISGDGFQLTWKDQKEAMKKQNEMEGKNIDSKGIIGLGGLFGGGGSSKPEWSLCGNQTEQTFQIQNITFQPEMPKKGMVNILNATGLLRKPVYTGTAYVELQIGFIPIELEDRICRVITNDCPVMQANETYIGIELDLSDPLILPGKYTGHVTAIDQLQRPVLCLDFVINI